MRDLLLEDLRSKDWRDVEWSLPSSDLDAPLIIAVTGDLTQKADPSEFNRAADFLNELAETSILGSRVGLNSLFVVPGNHDVVFDESNPETRFTPYCNFYNKLFKTLQPNPRAFARSDEASSLSQIMRFPKLVFSQRRLIPAFTSRKKHSTKVEVRLMLEQLRPYENNWSR